MILVLRQQVIDRMADDLYHNDPMRYDPLWKVDAEGWHVPPHRNPRNAVVRMVQLINKHNRKDTDA